MKFHRASVVALLLLVACTPAARDDTVTTTTAAPPPASTTTTGLNAPVTTTTPEQTSLGPALLLMFRDRLLVRNADGTTVDLLADFEIPIRVAFGDGNGGIVYQYTRAVSPFPSDAVLHLRAGASSPTVITSAPENRRIRLVDVGLFQGLPQILYLETGDGVGRLQALPLAGGSPSEVASGENLTDGTFSGDLVAVVERSTGCTTASLFDVSGDELGTWDCAAGVTDAHLAADGSRSLALAQDGGVSYFEVDEHSNNADLTPTNGSISAVYDFDGDTVAIGVDGKLQLIGVDASAVTVDPGPGLRGATLLFGPVSVPETAFLGGIREPGERCSAEGLAVRPMAQEGLPAPVAFIRTEIVEAATQCDYDALEELTAPGFVHDLGGSTSPLRTWVQAEQNREDVLAQIVAVLDTPYTTSIDDEGNTVYTWPGAFQDNPTEADWEAIVPIYNEEEVDFFRSNGYVGMRVLITQNGDWLAAVAGD